MISLVFTIIAFITNLILLLLVTRKGLRNATHLTFFLLIISYIVYLVPNYISTTSVYPAIVLMNIRMIMAIAIFQTALFFIFAKTFPDNKLSFSKRNLALLLFYSLGIAIFCFTPWLFSGIDFVNGNLIKLKPEFGVFIFGFTTGLFIILGTYNLIKKYRVAVGIQKMQLLYVIIGNFTTYTLLFSLSFVFSVITKTDFFPKMAAIFFLPFTILTTYAITRHRLFDIRLLIQRWFIKSVVVVIISGVGLGIIYVTNAFIVNSAVFYTVTLLVIIIAALVMNYIFDHYFTRATYDLSLPEDLELIENAEVALTQLRSNVIKTLRDIYKYETILFFVYDWREKLYRTYQHNKVVVLPVDHSVIAIMNASPTILAVDELKQNKTMPVGTRSEITQFMKRHQADIIIPLYTDLFTPGIIVVKRIDSDSSGINYESKLLEFSRTYGYYMERTMTFDALVRNHRTK